MGYAGSQFHRGPNYLQDPLTPLPLPFSYGNTEQQCTDTCPEGTTGTPITVVIQAGTYFSSESQADADEQALVAACNQAAADRVNDPCVLSGYTQDFFYRQRGGTYTLVGKNEYACHASTPPKKYRRWTVTGSFEQIEYLDEACTNPRVLPFIYTYSGSNTWDDDGNETVGVSQVLTQNGVVISTTPISTTISSPCDPDTCFVTNNWASAQVIQTGTGDCCAGMFFPTAQTGIVFLTLTEEDTDQDAIDRMLAAEGPYGPFLACGGFPCGQAKQTVRTSGFSADYIEGQFQVAGSSFPVSTSLNAKLTFRRTNLSTSDVDYFFLNYPATSDNAGAVDLQINIPVQVGFLIEVIANPIWTLT